MKQLLIDTDIGIDCDDAVALSVAAYLQKTGRAKILGVSTCTAREGASGSVSAIADYYGEEMPTASYFGNPLECDKTNIYAKAIKDSFKKEDSIFESVKLLREKLASSSQKITLVSIGPFNVIASLLESPPDEISALNGVELVKEKVDCLYSMGGNFMVYNEKYVGENNNFPEWNIFQDVRSAQTVTEILPVPLIMCPHEVGCIVHTGQSLGEDTPGGKAIRLFYEKNPDCFKGVYSRESWDPITVCLAVGIDLCDYSEFGKITVNSNGITTFKKGEGNHRFAIVRDDPSVTANVIESFLKELELSAKK